MRRGTSMSGDLAAAVRRSATSRLRERGSASVEFALVAPVVIMLLMGTITTGLSYSHALGVTNAVREGARFGAIGDASSASWAADVIARVRATEFNDVGSPPPPSRTSVCVELWKGPSPGASLVKSSCDVAIGPGVAAADYARFPIPTSLPTGVCVVRVVATRNFEIEAPPLLPPLGAKKMVRGSVARYERTGC
jgi:hypothetical protein